jgi:hypothetical protein
VKRSKDRGRLNRKKLEELGVSKQRAVIPIDEMILPDGQCRLISRRHPKARFATEEKATLALAQARRKRAATGSTRVEKRVYPCPEGGCGGWHLSARAEFDEELHQGRKAMYDERRDA